MLVVENMANICIAQIYPAIGWPNNHSKGVACLSPAL